MPLEAINFVQSILSLISTHVNFYVVDVAQKEDGNFIVIELNDAQMSGLSDNRPENLYGNLLSQLQKGVI